MQKLIIYVSISEPNVAEFELQASTWLYSSSCNLSRTDQMSSEIEHILYDALEIIGVEQVTDRSVVEYGPRLISVAPQVTSRDSLWH